MKNKYTLTIFFLILFLTNSKAQTLQPGMPTANSQVWGFAKYGNTMYFGGQFTQVNGAAQEHLSAFNTITGAVIPIAPTPNRAVYSMATAGNKIIVGGEFDTVGTTHIYGICMYDAATGVLDPWVPTYPGFITTAIGTHNNLFYYTGWVGGLVKLFCVDANTGNYTGWESETMGGDVHAILQSGNFVYCAGEFSFGVGGNTQKNFCRYYLSTGLRDTSFHPANVNGSEFMRGLADCGGNIFVGGSFTSMQGQSRNGLACFTPAGTMTSFNLASSATQVWSMCSDGNNYLWVGGNSHTYGTKTRWRLAEIDIAAVNATCFDPSAVSNSWSWVDAIYVNGDTVYAAPSFATLNLAVFVDSPRPHPGVISGTTNVSANQTVTYSVAAQTGVNYYWTITGGTGSSSTNSIDVTWGPGPTGSLSISEDNPALSDCHGDTVTIQVNFSSGIENSLNENTISVFPNPANDFVTAALMNETANYKIEITDALGRIVYMNATYSPSKKVDIHSLTPGIYFLKIISANGNSIVKKFVKE